MIEILQLPFFRYAALAALVLAGIHAYLGFHIVRRGVLFVDLALAQMAALGVAVGVALGFEHEGMKAYVLALGMTFVGAALLAWLRNRARNVPLEAFIGVVFATAQALVFLVLEKNPAGAEHLKETLVGSLYTVEPKQVATVAVLYAVIGLIHVLLRTPFFEITLDAQAAKAKGRKVFFWDFLFYATLGCVVTYSVQIAGVLLVFGFLVIPAVAGIMATPHIARALAVGWTFGFVASVAGLLVSVQLDFPAAPSILVALTGLLTLFGATLAMARRGAPRAA